MAKSRNPDRRDSPAASRDDAGDADLVPLARVTKAHGLRGEFRAYPLAGESENLDSVESVVLRRADGRRQSFAVESTRPHASYVLMKLAGLDRIEDVEPWTGAEILAPPTEIEPLPDGEYYWYELVGMTVLTHDARGLGRVTRLFATGSNDVLVVADSSGREHFIPYTDDAVASIDRDTRTITLTNQKGLEEL